MYWQTRRLSQTEFFLTVCTGRSIIKSSFSSQHTDLFWIQSKESWEETETSPSLNKRRYIVYTSLISIYREYPTPLSQEQLSNEAILSEYLSHVLSACLDGSVFLGVPREKQIRGSVRDSLAEYAAGILGSFPTLSCDGSLSTTVTGTHSDDLF